MTQIIITVCLVGASIIHLLPVVGIFGAGQLAKLYGVVINDPNLLLLMRHRAVLFGLLGLALLWSALYAPVRSIVIVVGLVSTIFFVLLAMLGQTYNQQISKVIKADVVAVILLIIAAALHHFKPA
ncbi:MAG: hypothetical protein ACI9LU_002015 [Polaribacter sp.]|jgi:hypothetical protein